MPSDLRARLHRLTQQSESSAESAVAPLKKGLERGLRHNRTRSLQQLQGYWQETAYGETPVLDRFYPGGQEHGGIPLRDFGNLKPEILRYLAGTADRFLEHDPDRTLFFDTETTGLSGGAGTYVFLMGLGFFEDGQLVVRQFLLPTFDGEPAHLAAFDQFLEEKQFRSIVTFNGKSFDLNLMESRLILNGRSNRLATIDHLDLLYPSRLLWKEALRDCSLQSLERNVLGLFREGDVPSAMIPRLFFQFVRSGDAGCLRSVLRHNRLDLLSMISLAVVASSLLSEPDMDRHVDALAVSRFHRTRGNREETIRWLERALEDLPASSGRRQDAQLALADLLRRCGHSRAALDLYLEILNQMPAPPLKALEGAAKILEHQEGDLQAALQVVERGLQVHPDPDLRHRCFRLRCRLQGKRWY